jgi:hypothetical protein
MSRRQLKIDSLSNAHHGTCNLGSLVRNIDAFDFAQTIVGNAELFAKRPILIGIQHLDEECIFFQTLLQRFFFEQERHAPNLSDDLLRHDLDTNVQRQIRCIPRINQGAHFEAGGPQKFQPRRLDILYT